MTISELENWFANAELPKGPIQLSPGTTIVDVKGFLSSHFAPLKKNPESKINQPSYDRLIAFKLLIESAQIDKSN